MTGVVVTAAGREHDPDTCMHSDCVKGRENITVIPVPLKSRFCRGSQHWACYGKAGVERQRCACYCHNNTEGQR